MSLLSPIEKRFDLGRWLDKHATPETKMGNEWICDCPKCGRAGKLAVNVGKKAWQCWLCDFAGRKPKTLVAAYLQIGSAEASRIIETEAFGLGTTVDPLAQRESVLIRRFLPEAPQPPGTLWRLEGEADDYADRRGISADNKTLFGLSSIVGDGTGSTADRLLAGRLLIPVWVDGRFVYWIARATDESNIKVVNLPSPDKHRAWGLNEVNGCATRNEVLVGLHLVNPGDCVYLVEGPMDAVVCGPGFVATMGSSISVQQAHLLAASQPSEVVVLYDGDDAGRKGAIQAQALLSAFFPTRIATCPEGSDPAEIGRIHSIRLSSKARGVGEIAPLLRK